MKKQEICIVLTSPLDGQSEIADHLERHGDSVRDIALLLGYLSPLAFEKQWYQQQGVSLPTVH